MTKENSIDKALGLPHIEETYEIIDNEETNVPVLKTISLNLPIVNNTLEEDDTYQDIEKARKNIEEIIEKGGDSLTEMIDLAKQSESARAFEVAANLMKTLLDANKDFVEMSMKKRTHREEILNPKDKTSPTQNITNNNLVLSTKDLLEMIKGKE